MKKILYSILILFSTIFLVSCMSKVDFKPIISKLSDIYTNEDTKDSVKNDLNLKTKLSDYEGLEIQWVSSNPAVLTNEGVVTRTSEDVKVELKLVLKYQNQTKVEYFYLTIIKEEKEDIEDVFYEVIFVVEENEYQKEKVLENEKVNKPTNPEKEGYTFIGWFINDEEFDFDSLVTENLTLTAKFEKDLEKYNVLFIVDGIEYQKETVLENTKVNKPTNPKKEGYTFIGWFINDKEFDFDSLINSNVTLTAKFEHTRYEVVFKVDNKEYLTNMVLHNDIVEIPRNPEKEGYRFIKWTFNGKEYNFNTQVKQNLVLIAEFVKLDTPEHSEHTIIIDEQVFNINDIKNQNFVKPGGNNSALFPEDEPIRIYDKNGYNQIVKQWEDVFYNNTIFAVVENGYIVETYERHSSKNMNKDNPASINNTTNTKDNKYWKNFNISDNGYLVIAQNQVHWQTKEPIHDPQYFNELANATYNTKYNRISMGGSPNLPNKVIRNGKVLKDHLGNELILPVYQERDEVRAVWISTVWNMDLARYTNEKQYKNEIIKTLNHIESLKFNTVFFQVRPMNDAFYPSKLAPYSRFIKGTEGAAPDFDILRFVIDEAHKRDIELHAWLNPYRVATSKSGFDTISKDNFAYKNPDLVISKNNSYILNPGETRVQQYIQDVIDEIITNYKDIDGIHFDDYFYLNTFGEDSSSPDYQTYLVNKEANETIADFRRRSVNTVIKNIFELIEDFNAKNNKTIKFGVAPTGIWRNGTNIGGSATQGQEHYSDLYADSKKWIKEGWLHYIMPQLYWPFDKFNSAGNPVAPFANLVHWWNDTVDGTEVSFIIGQGFYRFTETDNDKKDWLYEHELVEQLRYIQQFKNVKGVSIFTYNTFNSNLDTIQNSIADLTTNYWTQKVKPTW